MQIHREVPDQSRRPHQLLAAETYPLEVRPGLGGLGRDFRRDREEGLFLREGVGLGFRKVGTEGGWRWHSELRAGDKVGVDQKLDLMTLEGFSKLWDCGIVGRWGCRS